MENNLNPIIAMPKFMFDEDKNMGLSPQIAETHHLVQWKSKRGLVPMTNMDDDYLQKAFQNVMYAELEHKVELERLNDTKEHLLFEAAKRNIRLKWLDEITSRNFDGIFKAERAVRKIITFAHDKYEFRKKFREDYAKRMEEIKVQMQQQESH